MRTYEPMGHSQAQTRLLAGYPSGLLKIRGLQHRRWCCSIHDEREREMTLSHEPRKMAWGPPG